MEFWPCLDCIFQLLVYHPAGFYSWKGFYWWIPGVDDCGASDYCLAAYPTSAVSLRNRYSTVLASTFDSIYPHVRIKIIYIKRYSWIQYCMYYGLMRCWYWNTELTMTWDQLYVTNTIWCAYTSSSLLGLYMMQLFLLLFYLQSNMSLDAMSVRCAPLLDSGIK